MFGVADAACSTHIAHLHAHNMCPSSFAHSFAHGMCMQRHTPSLCAATAVNYLVVFSRKVGLPNMDRRERATCLRGRGRCAGKGRNKGGQRYVLQRRATSAALCRRLKYLESSAFWV